MGYEYLYDVNPNTWGPKLENDLHNRIVPKRYAFIAIAETHLVGQKLNRAYKRIKGWHYEAAFANAAQNSDNKGTHGGSSIMWKSHLDSIDMGPGLKGQDPRRGVGRDWVATLWLTKGQSILIIVVYMTCSIGYTGENVEKFAQIASCIRSPM